MESFQGRTVWIDMPATTDTGSFARYVPFGDRREVIARRGKELGHWYGLAEGSRRVQVNGGEFEMVEYAGMLSPPVFSGTLMGDSDVYHPVYLVLYLPGVELMMDTKKFSPAEVEMILGRVRVA